MIPNDQSDNMIAIFRKQTGTYRALINPHRVSDANASPKVIFNANNIAIKKTDSTISIVFGGKHIHFIT